MGMECFLQWDTNCSHHFILCEMCVGDGCIVNIFNMFIQMFKIYFERMVDPHATVKIIKRLLAPFTWFLPMITSCKL